MEPAGLEFIKNLFFRILSLTAFFAFTALTVMLFIAGFKFLTSGGESKGIQSASNTITWAILGIVFLVLAWLILKLIEAFTGVPVTQFCIGFDCP